MSNISSENNKDTKLIFNSYIAKQLLNMGNPIIDLIKNNKNKNSVVFVFNNTDLLKKSLSKISYID